MLLASLGAVVSCGPAAVTFPDPNLEIAIREAINKPEGSIYPSDLEGSPALMPPGEISPTLPDWISVLISPGLCLMATR